MKLLNPVLFRRLQSLFGEVEPNAIGEPCVAKVTRRIGNDGKVIKRAAIGSYGEYYRFRCPFCNDDNRKRCWINNAYGQKLQGSDYPKTTGLWGCYNEECQKNPANDERMKELVLARLNAKKRGTIPVRPAAESEYRYIVEWPGECTPLTNLAGDHPAVHYLTGRNYDVKKLCGLYDLHYCTAAYRKYWPAEGRIVIPITHNGEMVGWQARYVGTPPDKRTPKYYTLPKMPKSRFVYNLDFAKTHKYIVVVEGPTSAWRVGPHAVATFGQAISQFHYAQLGEWCREDPRRAMVLMQDFGVDPLKLKRRWRSLHDVSGGRCALVRLASDDPGSRTTEQCAQLVNAALAKLPTTS